MSDENVEILLVEDNPTDAELTMRALKKNLISNSIVHVKDGAEALAYLFREDGSPINMKPKVILLDLKLPKLSGSEVLARIKSDPTTKMIPVVVLTSSREDSDLQKCYDLGANSYIVKPVDFESFVKAVAELGFYWLLRNQHCH